MKVCYIDTTDGLF